MGGTLIVFNLSMSDECRAELMTKIKEISLRPEPVYIDSDNEELELDLKEQQLVVRLNLIESTILRRKNTFLSGKIEKFHILWKNVWQFKIFAVYL